MADYIFLCYPTCSTCKQAKKFLEKRDIPFTLRDISKENPNSEELKEWITRSGLPLKRFFNTSGISYRNLNLKDKLPGMSEEEKISLLATDGMLVKRPILVGPDTVLVGFRAPEWEKLTGS